jgi:Mlc titration factor MtfA (ptsG expression regulator)
MFFSWLRKRRRQKLLAQPFPEDWLAVLDDNVPHYQTLTEPEQAKLRDDLRIFLAEKEWEGCGGLELTDEIRVTVAAFACLLTLGMPDNHFERVLTVLIYPEAYLVPDQPTEDGLLMSDSEREGEAHYRGPVVLNWVELLAGARDPGPGHNLVLHEFAHQLDMLNGEADGVPLLPDAASLQRWQRVAGAEFRRLIRAVEHGRPTLLDSYGAEHESEFFAVTTECFFNQPRSLRDRHPELYDLFADYYNQDPAERMIPWEEW